eukprot:5532157-Karenia_brevis.AAC.1
MAARADALLRHNDSPERSYFDRDQERSRSPAGRSHRMDDGEGYGEWEHGDVPNAQQYGGYDNDNLMSSILAKHVKITLPPDVRDKVVKSMKEYKLNVQKKVKFKDAMAKDNEDIARLRTLRDANGVKPWKTNEKDESLDKQMPPADDNFCLSQELSNGVKVRFEFPTTPTFRDARRAVHYLYQSTLKQFDITMGEQRLGELNEATKFSTFARQCGAATDNFSSKVNELDLDLPGDMFSDTDGLTQDHAKKLVKGM